jgi:predicted aspartyl protease
MTARLLAGLLCAELACATPQTVSPPSFSVPFDFIRNQIVLDVRVRGGSSLRMLLDTAGAPSAVDLATADRIGLPIDRGATGVAEGVGADRVRMFASRLEDVELGGRSFGNLDAVALDLGSIAERFGQPIHGILGQGFLEGRIVQIDYPGRTLRFFTDEEAARHVAERRGRDIYVARLIVPPGEVGPLLEVHVDGTRVDATLDTGSSLGLELDPRLAEELDLARPSTDPDDRSVIGARGRADVGTARARVITLGTKRWENVAVTVRPMGDDLRRGNLGNALLRTLVVTVDDKSGTLRFTDPTTR